MATTKKAMDDGRAIELVKWGPDGARPVAKNAAEYTEAIEYVGTRKRLWEYVLQNGPEFPRQSEIKNDPPL
jgi:hypothetical protein